MPRPRKATASGDPADLIKQAIDGLDAQIRDWTAKRDQLARLLPEGGGAGNSVVRRRGRPPGSKNKAAARASASENAKPKRKVSRATRKKLKEAAQARWARIKAEQEG